MVHTDSEPLTWNRRPWSLANADNLRVLVDFSFSTRDMDYGLEDKSIVYLLTLAFFFAAVKAFRCEW